MANRSKKSKKTRAIAAEPAPPPSTALPWKPVLQILLLVGLALWIYGPALRGAWLWDDDVLVTAKHEPAGHRGPLADLARHF